VSQPADDDDASSPKLPAPAPPSVRAPHAELPDLATRIAEAQRQARQRRVEQGLPAEPDDGAYTVKRPRKHAPKRGKRHGQFLGTVCDSWEELRGGGTKRT
jgi:hypothetical protein